MQRLNIAMDGPAGAGKSTLADRVAKALGIVHLDTGAMYRMLALKALRRGIDPGDASRVIPILPETDVTVRFEGGVQSFFLDGEDVTGLIRTDAVSKGASDIAVIPEVRLKLVEIQRRIAREMDVVMDGRDITTYVLKESPHKFFVTASPEVRAKRRLAQIQEQDPNAAATLEEIMTAMEARDKTDAGRAFAPLQQAPDAVLVDTTHGSVEDGVRFILDAIRGR